MELTEIIPREIIPALTWLGKREWLNYGMEQADDRTAFSGAIIHVSPDAEPLRPALEKIREAIRQDDVAPFAFYCLSKALAQGPKLLKVTPDQCRALEHVDVSVSFADYQQPYPAVFIELPVAFRNELRNRFGQTAPKYVVAYHDRRTGYVIAISCGTACMQMIVNLLPPRPEYTSVEQALRRRADDGADIDMAEVVQRVALNCCLMLTHLGVKEQRAAHPARAKKLLKTVRNKTGKKVERAKNMLAVMPTLIGFKQEIEFFSEEKNHRPAGKRTHTTESSPRKPHWRRGHFRRQRVGIGRTERKLVFIRPVLVNSQFFAGDEKDTQVTYSGKSKNAP